MKTSNRLIITSILFFLIVQPIFSNAQIKILFDCKKAESVANADWVVDADQYNLGNSPTGIMVAGNGSEANPQSIPTPSQSVINNTTNENYWTGGISAWGVQMAKLGYIIETLPNNASITYGNTNNPQDLSNYKVYVVVEPNIVFSAAEKTAIMNFVRNGGGLFMIANHAQSDRNFDNYDAPEVWNDLISNNSVQNNGLGFQFNYDNFSQTTTNVHNNPADSITNGPMGQVTRMKFSAGTSMTLNPNVNPSVKGVIFRTGSAVGDTGVMMAYGRFGLGKFAAIGDSSPADDGTGDLNDVLYDGWASEVNGDHAKVITNATIWLAESNNATTSVESMNNINFFIKIFPNPTNDIINVYYNLKETSEMSIELNTINGITIRNIVKENQNKGDYKYSLSNLQPGFYILRIKINGQFLIKNIVVT